MADERHRLACGKLKETSRTASTLPKRFTTLRISTVAVTAGLLRPRLRARRRRHQRPAVDHAAGQQGRKLCLRPADHLHGGAVDQHLGLRRGPEHLVDEVVRAIGAVGDAVAIEVESRVVAPVVAASSLDQSR